MIQMQTTQAGLAAITSNQTINFTRFVAGSGQDINNTQIQIPEQEVSIARATTYLAGQTYTINGVEQVVDYNSVKLVGILDTSLASSAYQWSELALMARIGSDATETTIAYGKSVQGAYTVTPSALNTYIINFELIFSDAPQVTVDTTQTGVTWTDFLQHENANITTGIHGLRYADGTLYVNDQPMSMAQTAELLAITGVDSILSAWPAPNLAWIGKVVLNRISMDLKRLCKREDLHTGQFIFQNNSIWTIGNGTEENSLLVVSDDVTPSAGEITLSDAQGYFLEWRDVETLDQRLRNLEEATVEGALSFAHSDTNVYNSEWVSRMTGSGTEVSPYMIYTPYDFNQIRNNTSAVYVLANNLDMSAAIGLNFSMENGGLVRGDVDETAPLYNNGNGFINIPIFSGTLDGNGKTIKGLTCCGDVSGIIEHLQGGKIQNLTLKDGFLVCTDSQTADRDIGGFVGFTEGGVYITNCVNYNTIISTCTNSEKRRSVAGIVGYADGRAWSNNVYIKCCCNHGALHNSSPNIRSSTCGIAGTSENQNPDNWVSIESCYNTSNLQGVNAVGITSFWYGLSYLNFKISNCYNSGALQGTNSSWSIVNSEIANGCEYITDCWARVDYGTHVSQVHTIDFDDMQGADFLDSINANLVNTAYVADDTNANGGLPMLNFEHDAVAGIPNLPVALIDIGKGKVYSSKFYYNDLSDCAKKPELRRLKEQLTTLATKSELGDLEDSLSALATKQELTATQQLIPTILHATLTTAGWGEDGGLIYQDIQHAGVTSSSTVMLVPQSADCFTYGLTVGTLSEGSIRITASSLPADSISIGLLIAS